MVEATKKVIGNILISRAFSPSISAGLGPLGAYKINKNELIILDDCCDQQFNYAKYDGNSISIESF